MVLKDKAAIFVDGRYTVQVREQVDEKLFEYVGVPASSPAKWLAANAPEGAKIGYDAWLHSKGWAEEVAKALEKKHAELVPVDGNPIDAVWADRPEPSNAPALVHADAHSGRSSADKRAEVADWLKEEGYDAAVVSALDSVAWLLNIRGTDVERTPVTLSYVIAHADGTAELFIGEDKVTPELTQHLGNAVTIRPRLAFEDALRDMKGKTVAVDPNYGVAAIFHSLEGAGAKPVAVRDPTILPRAIKNAVEQQGHRDAQARDGAAIAKYLHWLSVEGPKGVLDELSAAAQLRKFRDEASDTLRDLSFDTISAAGPHAALPHYRVDEDSNIPIAPSSIYLCDSGGQYLDGTTDITRTVWIGPGEPSAEQKDRNTRVLKGHIAIARAIFPQGHRRRPARRLRASVPVVGRRRLRARHRARRRQFPLGPRRAAADRQDHRRTGRRRPATDGGNDPFERARLLQGGRLRHPDREPRPRRQARDRGRGGRLPRVRDADLRSDRQGADRDLAAHRGGARVARRLSRAGEAGAGAATVGRCAGLAGGGLRPVVGEPMFL